LHLVAVTDERWRVGREDFLSKIPDTVRAWSVSLGDVDTSSVGRDKPVRAVPRHQPSAADGLVPSEHNRPRPGVHSLAVMPDHVHVSVRAPTDATPREVAEGLRRGLNLSAGCALFSPRMYAGTFSDYALSAIRQRP
jgi:hypothetical protein